MATVFTFHTGKAIVQITAIEIATDYLLDIGPSESVLPGEILIKDLEKGFKIIFNAAVVIRILRRNYMKKDILCQGDFRKGIFAYATDCVVDEGVHGFSPSRTCRLQRVIL